MKGFSVVETIIVIAVGIILAAIIVSAFSGFRDSQALNSTAEEVVASINKARSESLASKNFLQHGIHFETNQVVVFQGITYSPSDVNNVATKLSPFIEISSTSLNGGGADMVFQKFTGKTGQNGTITLRVKKNTTKIKIITVESTGVISIQ